MAETIDRAMKILAHEHMGDARLGPLCLELVNYPSPGAMCSSVRSPSESPDRVVRGQAILALAQYQKSKGELVRDLQKPDGHPDERFLRAMYGKEYLAQLRAADPRPMFSEADRLFARVVDGYGEIAFTAPSGQPTRETLADIANRDRKPGPGSESR